MDPKGYFLIAIDRKKKNLRVGYCIFKKLGNKPINDNGFNSFRQNSNRNC